MKRKHLALLLSLLLTACGFHLRGMVDVPEWLNNLSVSAQDNNKELVSILSTRLDGYHIMVNPDPARAKYWLIIDKSTVQRQIVSIGASTNPRQYQLTLSTEFSLLTPKGEMIQTPRTIRVMRQFTLNNDRILGSTEEESILISEMRQDTATQIITMLSKLHHAH